jgi:hypothetical protein
VPRKQLGIRCARDKTQGLNYSVSRDNRHTLRSYHHDSKAPDHARPIENQRAHNSSQLYPAMKPYLLAAMICPPLLLSFEQMGQRRAR